MPHDVRAGDVGITYLEGVKLLPGTRIVPVFCAIPMGWTHSLAVCQAVLEGLARQVDGVTAENALVDRQLAPDINPMIHTEYADNFESYAVIVPDRRLHQHLLCCISNSRNRHTTRDRQNGAEL